jgi:hypothetical protein
MRGRGEWRAAAIVAVGVVSLSLAAATDPSALSAQEPDTPQLADSTASATNGAGPLRVFLDCKTRCDRTFYRTEITFVNWVRDRFDAQVQVIITDQDTGGGGEEFIFQFLGLQDLAGQNEELRFVSNQTDTDDEVRNGQTRVLAIGLANYSAMIGRVEGIEVRAAEDFRSGAPVLQAGIEDDPWHLWVFNIRGNGSLAAEELEDTWAVNGSISANRTTETWKVRLASFGFYRQVRQELNDGSVFKSVFRSWRVNGGVAYALADHWSLGATGRISSESRQNLKRGGLLGGGVEYSFFPYEEATRRQVLLVYRVGVVYNVYEEITIYDQTEETRPAHELTFSMDYEQPWGEAGFTVQGMQFLHDTKFYEVSAWGDLDFRIARGLSLNLRASGALIENQIFLPKGDLTDEEILTGQFERGTPWRYSLSVGFRYAFGSIYNNVVNNRFDRGF